ncbi:MAG TPA: MFS transporter [Alphaproteobacteria bacterium]
MSLTRSEVRIILVGALLAIFLAALEQTVVATALPSIAADLGGFELISWVVTAYMLSSVCATPIVGKLSDLYGRRPVLSACLAIFLGGSVLCALAPGMVPLIVARGIQGIGGGGLITLGQTIIGDVISPRERGRYAAYFSGVWATSALLGPVLGGLLAEHAGWPWIFWINLPLGFVVLLLSDRALKKLPAAQGRGSIDYIGITLLSLGAVALLLVLSLGGKRLAWTSTGTIGLVLVAGAACAAFMWRQRTVSEPILPPRFLVDRVVGPVLGASFLVFGSYLAVAVLAPVYFQVALGVSASDSGILMIPLLLSTSIASALAGRYNRRSGRYRRPPLISLPLAIAGLVVLGFVAGRLGPIGTAALLTLVGLGIGPIFPCSMVAAQSAVAPRDLGAVSGAVGFSRSLGGAVAIAAAVALVLGIVRHDLPETGAIASLEDLARTSLTPHARAIVAYAFTYLFWAIATTLFFGFLTFARVEDRLLHTQSGSERTATGD